MIERLTFGRTKHESTRTIFGAAALAGVTQDVADRTLEVLLRHEINHIDTAANYGASEDRLGPWMADHRDRFFLATKTGQRSYDDAAKEIRRSLERMQVEQIDLIQLHNLVDPSEWDTAMGRDGALRACLEAREAGIVRFIGVTGHGLSVAEMHLRSLVRHDFDSVLLPFNYPMMRNPAYAADFERLIQMCRERHVAVQTIKSTCRRPWATDNRFTTTWYEPFTEQDDVDKAVWWVLGRRGVFLNTTSDVSVLAKILDAAERYTEPTSDEEMERLVADREMAPLFA